MFYRILNKKRYSERDAAKVVREILEVVGACHTRGVIHRDIKPENFLFSDESEESDLKLVDFGLSTFYNADDSFHDICGTAFYLAPEVLQKNYNSQVDLWSVGVIAFILLSGGPPFVGKSNTEIYKKILNSESILDLQFQKPKWERISIEAKDFLYTLLERNPEVRVTAAQVCGTRCEWALSLLPFVFDGHLIGSLKRWSLTQFLLHTRLCPTLG